MEFRRHCARHLRHLISAPFIYAMIVPLAFLDLMIEVYHRLCFPLYGLKWVNRSRYIRIDRHRLSYLTPLERMNCAYCGYANGLLPYAATIAAETEKYWCGIMHEKKKGFVPPSHHKGFLRYGDEKQLNEFVRQGKDRRKN